MAKTKQNQPRQNPPKQPAAPQTPAQTPNAAEPPKTERWQAALCYLGILILVPAAGKYKARPFVAFHLNQGLVLLALGTLAGALYTYPPTNQFGFYASLLVDALSMAGLINALMGRAVALPGIELITKKVHPFG